MSDQSHSALSRAAMIVGVWRDRMRIIRSAAEFRVDMDTLASPVAADRDASLTPIAVAANAGTVGKGAIDRHEELADFRAAEGLWLHVDTACGGFAVMTEQGKRRVRGIERADSTGLGAHKWFFQPCEAGAFRWRTGARSRTSSRFDRAVVPRLRRGVSVSPADRPVLRGD